MHEGSDVQEAREDPGRRERKASETFSRSRYTAFSRRRRRKEAFTEGPNEAMAEFKDVGTPACTRQTERLLQHAWMATVQQFKRRRGRWDTGGLTANNNHAGGVEDLRNHAVVKSQRPEKREREEQKKKSSANCRQKKSSANCRQEKSSANCRQRRAVPTAGKKRAVPTAGKEQ